MGRPVLHQFVVGAVAGDAITDQALLLRKWLRGDGFRSELFAESMDSTMASEVRPYLAYHPSAPGEMVILHHSIGSAVVDHLLSLDVRIMLVYHNITPPEFVTRVDPVLAGQLTRGRVQLTRLRERTVLGLADSLYNEAELKRLEFVSTGVLPIVLDESRYRCKSNAELLGRYQGRRPYLLFVGRLVPHKRQEDVIKLLYCYRRIDPSACLFLVGACAVPAYAEWLEELTSRLGLRDAVVFAGSVSQRDLVTYYRLADLYVSMSEHEGFGKPLAESMLLGLPVLAYDGGAVAGTLGGSGVLFHEKHFEALAELVDLLVCDRTLRERIVVSQRCRVQAFLEPQVLSEWGRFLDQVGVWGE